MHMHGARIDDVAAGMAGEDMPTRLIEHARCAMQGAWRGVRMLASCLLLMLALSWHPAVVSAQSVDWKVVERQLAELRSSPLPETQLRTRTDAIAARITADAPYAIKRALALVRIRFMQGEEYAAQLKALRELATANGDQDTVDLMRVRQIYDAHTDDNIEVSLRQLDEVRLHLQADASLELREALEIAYGNMYWDVGSFELALRHLLRAREHLIALDDRGPDWLPSRSNNIAWLHLDMDNPDAALAELDGIDEMSEPQRFSPELRANLMVTRGAALRRLGRFAQAQEVLEKAKVLAQSGSRTNAGVRVHQELTEILLSRHDDRNALQASEAFMRAATTFDSPYFVAESQILHGFALTRNGRIDEGLRQMQSGIDYFAKRSHFVALNRALERKAEVLTNAGRHADAVATMREQLALSMRLFRSNRTLGLANLQVEQQLAEREKRILQLAHQNLEQREKLRRQRIEKIALGAILLSALVVAGLLGLLLRASHRQKQALWRDALTGAFNRHYFPQWLALHPADPAGSRAVVLLDMDDFKAINDRHGHAAGDAALQLAAKVLRDAVQGVGEVFRWGGEEFMVVLDLPPGDDVLQARVRAILHAMCTASLRYGDVVIPLSASMGCHRVPEQGQTDAMLANALGWADMGLYLAKPQGRRRACLLEMSQSNRRQSNHASPRDLDQLQAWIGQGLVRVDVLIAE